MKEDPLSKDTSVPRPDVTDMYAVHGVFRDSLGAAPRLVGGIVPGDAARVALIANYYENILSFLEAHHDWARRSWSFPSCGSAVPARTCCSTSSSSSTRRRSGCWRKPCARWRPGRRATPAPRRRPRTHCGPCTTSWSATSTKRRSGRCPWPRPTSRSRSGARYPATAWRTSTATRSG